jgi:hypothetical protein
MPKQIFLSFPVEDTEAEAVLKGKHVTASTAFEYVDVAPDDPGNTEWQERVRSLIRDSKGVLALVSKYTDDDAAQVFEIRTAIEEGKPILGVWTHMDDRTKPQVLDGQKITPLMLPALADFIDGCW